MTQVHHSWPDGYTREIFDELDSTNAYSLKRAAQIAGPSWIMAHRQTAGRGRRGRAWNDPVGNFAASLTVFPKGEPAQSALRSFIASLSLFHALVDLGISDTQLSLKWPNDVLLNGKKLAGILLEASVLADKRPVLVIGIGVNLKSTPHTQTLEAGALAPCAVLQETGLDIAPEALLDALAFHFAQFETQFATHGFAPIRAAWLSRAAFIGQEITARVGSTSHHGRFETIDAGGALVLTTDKGPLTIAAADVFAS